MIRSKIVIGAGIALIAIWTLLGCNAERANLKDNNQASGLSMPNNVTHQIKDNGTGPYAQHRHPFGGNCVDVVNASDVDNIHEGVDRVRILAKQPAGVLQVVSRKAILAVEFVGDSFTEKVLADVSHNTLRELSIAEIDKASPLMWQRLETSGITTLHIRQMPMFDADHLAAIGRLLLLQTLGIPRGRLNISEITQHLSSMKLTEFSLYNAALSNEEYSLFRIPATIQTLSLWGAQEAPNTDLMTIFEDASRLESITMTVRDDTPWAKSVLFGVVKAASLRGIIIGGGISRHDLEAIVSSPLLESLVLLSVQSIDKAILGLLARKTRLLTLLLADCGSVDLAGLR